MPGIDVSVRRVINAPRDLVADFVCNPDNTPVWCGAINAVQWHTQRPAQPGSRLEYTGWFLGKKQCLDYEIVQISPGQAMTLVTINCVTPLEIQYNWVDADHGCLMTMATRGELAALSATDPTTAERAVRLNTNNDLQNLAQLVEGWFGSSPP